MTIEQDDPNRCCGRQFCRTTLDLWREQDRLLQDIAGELGVEQPDEILPAIRSDRAESPAWQPIATAPKDGTHVLLFCHGVVMTGQWQAQWWDHYGEYTCSPTHWMPLPVSPKDTK